VGYAILIVDTLALIAAVVIAVWQHRVLGRYRRAERESQAQQAEQEHLQQTRRDRRESWEPVFRETDETLKSLEDIESEVRAQGPLDHDFIDQAELGRIQRHLDNISDRCPETLRDPVRAVAAAAARLRNVLVLSDAEVIDEYAKALAGSPPCELPPELRATAIGARAVEQYRAAVHLHEVISAAWKAVHTERGGEP
jgi:hypothetical protein